MTWSDLQVFIQRKNARGNRTGSLGHRVDDPLDTGIRGCHEFIQRILCQAWTSDLVRFEVMMSRRQTHYTSRSAHGNGQ